MLGLLSSIVNTVFSLISFLVNTFESFIDLLIRIPDYVAYLTSSIAFAPSLIQPFLLASISIYIIFLIVDR